MSGQQSEMVETLKQRKQDTEIKELLLKHNLTKKKVEHKLLIIYYKACNLMTKTKLIVTGINEHSTRRLSLLRLQASR